MPSNIQQTILLGKRTVGILKRKSFISMTSSPMVLRDRTCEVNTLITSQSSLATEILYWIFRHGNTVCSHTYDRYIQKLVPVLSVLNRLLGCPSLVCKSSLEPPSYLNNIGNTSAIL